MSKLSIVPAHLVDDLWPTVKDLIKAGSMGDATSAMVSYQDCRSGNAFLLVAYEDEGSPIIKAACVVRFVERENGLTGVIGAMGGGDMEWQSLLARVLEWSASLDAPAIEFEGRTGWQRVLPDCKVISCNYRMAAK